MANRITYYPATLPSADPLVMDAAAGSALRLLRLNGIGPLTVGPALTKGPSQEGETALDVVVPPRVVSADGYIPTTAFADLWAARKSIARAMANIPVRFGSQLDLGRLLIERPDAADVEIYGLPQSSTFERIPNTPRGLFDAEWLCPYPYFQATSDSTLTVPDATALQTSAAADDIIDASDHDLAIGDAVKFSGLAGGAGLSSNVVYYVVSASFGADTFRVATSAGGTALGFTTDITAGTVGKVSTADNVGDVDAPILARLYGPATAVTLTNLTTGETFTVTVSLTTGQWLEVDTTPGVKTVRKYTAADTWENAISGLDLADGRLWLMFPSNNSIAFSATGSGAATAAVLTWRPRYSGL